MTREIIVVFCGYRLAADNWQPPALACDPKEFVATLAEEFAGYGVRLSSVSEPGTSLEVRGYADLLNAVRLRIADGSLGNPCLGHVIGQSANCNLLEDIRRGVSRIAFAPETIEPDGSSKRVCHNCGCGC